ncbi:MAG: cold shock domain-containing protein [Bacteroidia bacterium]
MGKSQETFNKKDREKKKQRKRKEKEERKEERKTNSKKGKSFEDMIAYVDEFGKLSSTPPDPSKKTTIKQEDIQIGISKQEPIDPADLIRQGTVSFFNESKGYGFIRDNETRESIFVHASGLTSPINENDKVTFEVSMGQKGPNAVNVKIMV